MRELHSTVDRNSEQVALLATTRTRGTGGASPIRLSRIIRHGYPVECSSLQTKTKPNVATLQLRKQNNMPSENADLLARLVLAAQEMHNDQGTGNWRVAARAAAERACKDHPDLVEPIYLLNVYAWNDIQVWAKEQG